MKKLFSLILCAAMALALSVPAAAEGDDASGGSLRTSVWCESASMSVNRALFAEAEQAGPAAPLTRAMAAVILARHDGIGENLSAACPDVEPGAWYADAAAWACANGILSPDGDGLFHPEQAMDRASLCLALENYLAYKGKTLEAINAPYSFADAADMSAEGFLAAGRMQESGVLIEESDGYFYPARTVTVAEAESVFLRFFGALRTVAFPTLPVSTVAESEPVDDTWFDDVCFIGHSQVVAMRNNFDLYNAEYLAEIGFRAADMLVHKAFHMFSGRAGSLRRLLEDYSFGKIYIMLGINDCNDHKNMIEEFRTPMRQILDIVKETQPDATVYLISLAPVGRSVAYPTIYNPENTILFSQIIKDLSREYDTEYLDLFRLLCDDDGYMLEQYAAADGIHIRKEGYPLIEEFIKCHTVS